MSFLRQDIWWAYIYAGWNWVSQGAKSAASQKVRITNLERLDSTSQVINVSATPSSLRTERFRGLRGLH